MKKRKKYPAELKARVALEALRGEHTMTALSSRYKIHANLITKWKKRAQEGLVEVFSERQIPYHWIDIEEHAEGERIFVSDDHLSLTKNRNFQDDLLHILLDRPPSWER